MTLQKQRRRKKKSFQQIFKEKYESGDFTVGLLEESSGKSFEYYVQYSNNTLPASENEDTPTCYMFGAFSSQEVIFPPEDFEQYKLKHSWKVKNPNIKNLDGSTKQISAAETTSNWQPYNARA
ncbi:hypothetical protein RND81_07G103700 [Saponaria officinalis]|uniref:Uncharacterized protein n=1 Tax=Saponaria officinalis TaxID=3572 RepID=A0AAW1JNU6_SAPOF